MSISWTNRLMAGCTLTLLMAGAALAERIPPESLLGTRAPVFSLASNQGSLVNYDEDYYGRSHLVLTFFPAAFTPV